MTGPKRVTEKQLAANRANALRSTGPRTPEGKMRSRWNALTHGALPKAVVPPSLEPFESRQEFDALLSVLRDEFSPGSAVEEMLVERIATSYWRLARVLRAEAAAIASRQVSREAEEADRATFAAMAPSSWTYTDPLTQELQALSSALSNKRRLRALMVENDDRWRDADDGELLAAAESRLAELRQEEESRARAAIARQEDERSIPELTEALLFSRYETALERQLYRALDALERLQRLRGGEAVPPPLRIEVDHTGQDDDK